MKPALGSMKLDTVTRPAVARLHSSMSDRPVQANRTLAILSALYSWAGKSGYATEGYNPARGVEKFPESGRERFLTREELSRLGDALRQAETAGLPYAVDETKPSAKHAADPSKRRTKLDPFAVAAIRLLIFTGARLREILHAQWEHVDFERGVIFLPESKTGKKTIYLSAPALGAMAALPRVAGNPYIIAGAKDAAPRADLKKPWAALPKAADLRGLRIHDLRHSFASVGAGRQWACRSSASCSAICRPPRRRVTPIWTRTRCIAPLRRSAQRSRLRWTAAGTMSFRCHLRNWLSSVSKTTGAPDWFVVKDYSYLRDLDAGKWLKTLARCAFLRGKAEGFSAAETTFKEEWGFLDEGLMMDVVPGFVGLPPVQVVPWADQAEVHTFGHPVLILEVHLGATDADIMATFKRVLREARKKHPSTLRKRGRATMAGRFGKTEFDRWQRHKIVEISELLGWGARESIRITNADLGRWLFARHSDPDKAAFDALEVLRQAVESITALWAQVYVETHSGVTNNRAQLS